MKKRNDDIRLECVNWDEEQPATIKCKGQFLAVIDEIGDLQVAIEGMKAKVRHRLDATAEWALAHPAEAFERGGRGATAKYDYALKAAARSLRRLPDVSQEQAVALLSADGTMAKYVFTAYDSKQLGADFGGSKEKRESVRAYGLFFTDPGKDRLEVLS